jgi:hypothetical protein
VNAIGRPLQKRAECLRYATDEIRLLTGVVEHRRAHHQWHLPPGTCLAVIQSVTEPRDKGRHPEQDRDRAPSPRNLIRETSRFDEPDPPNLHRLSTRQIIEERGTAETHERFVSGGIVARVDEDEGKGRPR